MKRCTVCVMPDTRPDTAFIDGVCSACIAYKYRPNIDWQARADQLELLLVRAKATAKARGNHFDVIVPSSGGKDSHYQVMAMRRLGARPLVVTATTCHLTSVGRANIDNLARYATTLEVSPNKTVRAKLNRAGLEMVGDISWPEHVSIFTAPFRIASQTGIPFIFYGENPQNQYGGPMEAQDAQQMTRRWVSEFGGFLGLRPQDLATMTSEDSMADYMLPADEISDDIEAHFLGQYLPWDSHENARIAVQAGMTAFAGPPGLANLWQYENLDNAQTGLHDHMMYRKYGYGRGCAQASVDVRTGRMTRAEALDWVERNDGLFPHEYAGVSVTTMLDRIGMTPNELKRLLDDFTNQDLFEGEHNWRPILKAEG